MWRPLTPCCANGIFRTSSSRRPERGIGEPPPPLWPQIVGSPLLEPHSNQRRLTLLDKPGSVWARSRGAVSSVQGERGRNMEGSGIHALQLVFLMLLLFVVVFAALARKLKTPFPIVLVIAGLLLSFIPGIPKISLNPEIVFLVVLPPLLYSAAWLTSWRDFKFNLVSICFLAFGLVGFTVLGVAEAAHRLFSGFDWRLGFVLGAVVATTDAIAATSIAKRVGLPQRVVAILEGESLVNDATGLLALEFGAAMVVSAQTPTVGAGFLQLAYLTAGGLGLGLIVGVPVQWIHRQLDDAPIEITLGVLVPYAV